MLALVGFAFATSITPGPNNLMLMASGANFGFRRTIPHMLGVSLGFAALAFLVGVGLAQVFERYPAVHLILKTVSVAFLLYLAWRIANAAPFGGREAAGRPMSFLEAAAFQWVNPKAWAMALTAVTVYAPGRSIEAVALVALVFSSVNLPSIASWALAGGQLRRILTSPARLRVFNWIMAALLVATLYPVLVA
ncbi:MAG: LysE family translocator [Pseudomonadota bacterium]